ncbi:MAG: alanine racemase, partial [Vicinamibacteria bacterium]
QGHPITDVHISRSASILAHPEAHFTMARPGLMLYGVYPSPEFSPRADLRPVMAVKTEIVQLKSVPPGTSISYGRTFRARRETRVATIAIGYADGLSRHLSNRGEALVRGRRCPVIGRVCMDLTMLDTTAVADARVGDEVVLIGSQGKERITAEEMAEKIGTISYEVLCGISKRVPRRYVDASGMTPDTI